MKKDKNEDNGIPYVTSEEFDAHSRKMMFFFVIVITYTVGVVLGFIIDINSRYG